jgi:hypothetical protein
VAAHAADDRSCFRARARMQNGVHTLPAARQGGRGCGAAGP